MLGGVLAVLIVESLERFGDDLLGFDTVALGQLLDSIIVDGLKRLLKVFDLLLLVAALAVEISELTEDETDIVCGGPTSSRSCE